MVVAKTVDLRIKEWKGQQQLIEMTPIFFLTLVVQLCANKTKKKCIAYQLYSFTYDNKHGQQYTITGQQENGTFRIKIGHNYIFVWTHDTYTKVLGWKNMK